MSLLINNQPEYASLHCFAIDLFIEKALEESKSIAFNIDKGKRR